MPIIKRGCFVLWRKQSIPASAPMLPPYKSQEEQLLFGNTPFVFPGFVFVQAIDEKGKDINKNKVNDKWFHSVSS